MGNVGVTVSFFVGVIIALLIGKFVFKSSNAFMGILCNTAIGIVILWGLESFGYGIVLNWISAGVVGLLGVPGVILLVLLKYVLKLI